ncbi:MAG: hypothetical protein DRP60_06350 [Spirochaetes bacterium]|nr:MAG: hypothetical protein DRP60_06350 [Spirochaetota bacterium]
MLKKLILLTVSILLLNFGFLWAQEDSPEQGPLTPQSRTNQRSLGDQAFTISAGVIVPLFTVLLNDNPVTGNSAGVTDTQLTVGGMGSLTYSFYLSANVKLGLQLGGTFQWDINRNLLYMIPISIKGSYEFHPYSRLTIPVHLALGINMTSWKEEFTVDPLIRPGFGVYFDWNVEWSFGMDFTYWFIPQLSSKDERFDSLENFMDINIGAEYHF